MWIYEPDTAPGRCTGCHAPIRWAITSRLAKLPLNADFTETGQEDWNEQGVRLIEVPATDSHFTTCPMRGRFLSAKKKARE